VDDAEESGWKFVHGDVFRFPPSRTLFCALVGSGTQLLVLSFAVFGLALLGTFYPYNRGAMFTALIVLYALTAGAWWEGRGVCVCVEKERQKMMAGKPSPARSPTRPHAQASPGTCLPATTARWRAPSGWATCC
jgi:hypothetical protein